MTTEKRITIKIHQDIDKIRDTLAANTGIKMSYIQIINYLVHFYLKHSTEPRTQWRQA
jgi:sulfur relay (sulfurtransferase) DsrC/TusE family protein